MMSYKQKKTPSWRRIGLEGLLIAGALYGLASYAQTPEDKRLELALPVPLLYVAARSTRKTVTELLNRYYDDRWPYDE